MEIKDRMNQYKEAKDMTTQAFEKTLGMSNGSWAKNSGINEETLLRFTQAFPEVNPVWLLRGEGEMTGTEVKEYTYVSKESPLLGVCREIIEHSRRGDEILARLDELIRDAK